MQKKIGVGIFLGPMSEFFLFKKNWVGNLIGLKKIGVGYLIGLEKIWVGIFIGLKKFGSEIL